MPAPRRHRLTTLVAAACAALALGAAGAAAAGPAPPGVVATAPAETAPAPAPREVLVRFRAGVSAWGRARAARDAGVTLLPGAAPPGVRVARIGAGDSPAGAAADLRDEPEVAWAEPNRVRRAAGLPDDPLFPQLWAQRNTGQWVNGRPGLAGADVDAVAAWELAGAWLAEHPSGAAPIVAVVDTGVAAGHPDLAGAIAVNPGESGGGREANGVDDDANGRVDDWRGWDWVDADNDPFDPDGHGTHVAGTIAARAGDGYGVSGLAGGARILPLRVLGPDGGTDADVADAFDYAAAMGARVVNASLSGPGASMALEGAIAAHPDVLFVVAAGNEGLDADAEPQYPCAAPQPNVICVAATDQDDELASFSNRGATAVDLGAPGTSVLSSTPARQPRLADGFEAGAGAWTLAGTWGITDAAASEGLHSLADSPAGPYPNGAGAAATLAEPLDLSGGTGCSMRFDVRIATVGADALLVESSADGVAWDAELEVRGDSGGGFVAMDADLSALDGAPAARVRLRLVSDAAGTAAGVEVDRLEIGCIARDAPGGDFAFMAGTSMAAPQVAGAAALMMTAAPGLTAAAARAALLDAADPLPALAGATATGARLNAARALAAALAPLDLEPSPSPAPDPGPQPEPAPDPGSAPPAVTPEEPRPLRAEGGERAAADRVAPRLLRLALGRAAGGRRTAVLRLAEAARVRITVQRRLPGGGRARYATVRRTAVRALAGGTRRVALGRLPAGRYRLLVRMVDRAGNRAAAARALRLR